MTEDSKNKEEMKAEEAARDEDPVVEESLSVSVPEILTIEQAAEYLQINTQVLYRYVRQKLVPSAKVGTLIRFKKSVLDKWIEDQSWESIGVQSEEKTEMENLQEPVYSGAVPVRRRHKLLIEED